MAPVPRRLDSTARAGQHLNEGACLRHTKRSKPPSWGCGRVAWASVAQTTYIRACEVFCNWLADRGYIERFRIPHIPQQKTCRAVFDQEHAIVVIRCKPNSAASIHLFTSGLRSRFRAVSPASTEVISITVDQRGMGYFF